MSNNPAPTSEYFSEAFGNLKEECEWHPGYQFIGMRPKHYIYETEQCKKVRVAGLRKDISSTLESETFKHAIDTKAETMITVKQNMRDGSVREVERVLMREKDWTRYYIDDYTSVPYNHYLANDNDKYYDDDELVDMTNVGINDHRLLPPYDGFVPSTKELSETLRVNQSI